MSTQTSNTTARPTLAIASDPERALQLAPTFQPDVDLLTREGLITFGVKGSGKSNLLALIVEQLRRFHIPQLILDTEGEQASLLALLPHGVLATANACPSGYDIITKGLQVILDLKSWDTDEAAALAVCQLVAELFETCKQIDPLDRYPCVIHLDEAAYWLPQDSVSYLSKDTRKAIADAFHKLASRGRKQGLVPFLYTQSISEIRKETIRQAGIQILMRQTLDIDLNRYSEYIYGATAKTRAAIRAYPTGKAVVILPDGSQHRVQFNQRQTEHTSHTPQTQTAIKKFAKTTVDVNELTMLDMSEPAPASNKPAIKVTVTSKPASNKTPATIKAWVFSLLAVDPALNGEKLAAITKAPSNTCQIYRREYFVQNPDQKPATAPIEVGKSYRAIEALLKEHPDYTPSQIHKHVNVSLIRVKQLYNQIKTSQAV